MKINVIHGLTGLFLLSLAAAIFFFWRGYFQADAVAPLESTASLIINASIYSGSEGPLSFLLDHPLVGTGELLAYRPPGKQDVARWRFRWRTEGPLRRTLARNDPRVIDIMRGSRLENQIQAMLTDIRIDYEKLHHRDAPKIQRLKEVLARRSGHDPVGDWSISEKYPPKPQTGHDKAISFLKSLSDKLIRILKL